MSAFGPTLCGRGRTLWMVPFWKMMLILSPPLPSPSPAAIPGGGPAASARERRCHEPREAVSTYSRFQSGMRFNVARLHISTMLYFNNITTFSLLIELILHLWVNHHVLCQMSPTARDMITLLAFEPMNLQMDGFDMPIQICFSVEAPPAINTKMILFFAMHMLHMCIQSVSWYVNFLANVTTNFLSLIMNSFHMMR